MLQFVKRFKIVLLAAALLLASSLSIVPAYAASAREAVDSVVMVYQNYIGPDENGDPAEFAGYGSGFAIGQVGKPIQYIVTNFHVIAGAYAYKGVVQVFFSAAANRFVQAEVYWKNEDKDLAILRLPEATTERKAMVLCPSDEINIDDTFAALGYPSSDMIGNDFPKFDTSDISITKGGISKITRVDEVDCYLLDLDISSGNSGGPLVNSKGQVVGINSFGIVSPNDTSTKANYAITIDELIRNVDRSVIPLTVAGEISHTRIILIVCGVLGAVIILVAAVWFFIRRNKKGGKGAEKTAGNAAAASQKPMASVIGISGYFQGKAFSVGGQLKIGRDNNNCGLVFPIDQPGISGTHCVVSFDGSAAYLQDLGSSYGTYIGNGVRLETNRKVPLRNGEQFWLADEMNKFEVRIG